MLSGSLKFKIFVRFAVPTNLITNLTYAEDFVKVLRATRCKENDRLVRIIENEYIIIFDVRFETWEQ